MLRAKSTVVSFAFPTMQRTDGYSRNWGVEPLCSSPVGIRTLASHPPRHSTLSRASYNVTIGQLFRILPNLYLAHYLGLGRVWGVAHPVD